MEAPASPRRVLLEMNANIAVIERILQASLGAAAVPSRFYKLRGSDDKVSFRPAELFYRLFYASVYDPSKVNWHEGHDHW